MRQYRRRQRDRHRQASSAPPGRTGVLRRRRPCNNADRAPHEIPPWLMCLWPRYVAEGWALARDWEGAFGE